MSAEPLNVIVAEFEKNSRERIRVSLSEFRGTRLCDMRVMLPFAGAAANEFSPTSKGLAISLALLPTLRAAVVEAERQAIELGLIGGAE